MSEHFDVSGDEIFYGNRHVATLVPTLWATLKDAVALRIECAGPDMISEEDHEEAIKAIETEMGTRNDELEIEKADLEEQVDTLETENDGLRRNIREMAEEGGVADVIDELRTDLSLANDTIAALRLKLHELQLPKKRKSKAA